MEFYKLSKRVTGNWTQDCWSRSMSSAFDPFVLFVSFVVKQFCASARVLSLDPFSLVTHLKR
jgi:hypothetical protein